jgi:hypothetical protein
MNAGSRSHHHARAGLETVHFMLKVVILLLKFANLKRNKDQHYKQP